MSQHLTAEPEQAESPAATGDRPCHLLDEQDLALCFASVQGRQVHTMAQCRELQHPMCATCEELWRQLHPEVGTGTTTHAITWHPQL